MQTMLNRLRGPSRLLFRRLVGMAQRFAPLREDGLADVGLGWPVLRRMLHEIGQCLVTHNAITIPDDVFWLTQDELLEAVIALDRKQFPETIIRRSASGAQTGKGIKRLCRQWPYHSKVELAF